MSDRTRQRIERTAESHGWTVDHKPLNNVTFFERGSQFIRVSYTQSGGVLSVRVGKLGGREITGRGKADKVVELLARWEPEPPQWRCEVVTGYEKTWAANGLRYATRELAVAAGSELFGRWMAPRPRWRGVDESVPMRQPYVPGSEDGSWS
jgi:hypothetical protein